jgi:hypothetical protein
MSNIAVQVPYTTYNKFDTDPTYLADSRGSIFYNGYFYMIGSWLQAIYDPTWRQYQKGVIMKVAHDFSSYLETPIKKASADEASMSCRTQQLVRVDQYIYGAANWAGTLGIFQYDTTNDTYKMWKTQSGSLPSGLAYDGTFLYYADYTTVRKFLEADFRDNSWGQFNTDFGYDGAIPVRGTWDSHGLGFHPTDDSRKGVISSIYVDSADATVLWVVFGYGYGAVTAQIECHKVSLSTFASVGYCQIPDTMGVNAVFCTQNDTWLFIPCALNPYSSTSSEYGYTFSLVAVKKSDLTVKPLVRHGGTDTAPGIYADAAVCVGTSLFISKYDYTIYSIDISNVNSWVDTDSEGSHVLDVIKFDIQTYDGGGFWELNSSNYQRHLGQLAMDANGQFYCPLYYGNAQSGTYQMGIGFSIPGYSFTPPTVITNGAETNDLITTLHGEVTAGSGITDFGIRWGFSPDNLTQVVGSGIASDFHIALNDLATGTYYYQAYAVNSNGTGVSAVGDFTITGNNKVPTVGVRSWERGNYTMKLKGSVIHTNGAITLTVGFHYGTTANNLNNTVTCQNVATDFDYTLQNLPLGTYYYKAFAANSVGEGLSDVDSFEITKYLRIDVPSSDHFILDGTNGKPRAIYMHGSLYYNGYYYGSARNIEMPASTTFERIIRIARDNYTLSGITVYEFKYASENDTTILESMDQIQRVGDYIYGLCFPHNITDSCLVQLHITDGTYKIFSISADYSAPLIADETYLYVCGANVVNKYLESDFRNPAYPKFNTTNITVPLPTPVASFDHMNFGELNPPLQQSDNKGKLHNGCVDANYLFLGFTTGDDNTRYELQKVNKHTMVGDSWILIPKSTDDCAQNATHIFYGIEVQPSAPDGTYGKGWGGYAVRKSDLHLTSLPKYDALDGTGSAITSYASLIFGNYLVDQKTNAQTYILDISDVDNWTHTDPVGTHVLNIVQFYFNGALLQGYFPLNNPPTYGKPPNECSLDETGTFHSWMWSGVGEVMKFVVPGYNFTAAPIVQTTPATVSGYGNAATANLHGVILNANGSTITDTGFQWGTTSQTVSAHEVLLGETGSPFEDEIDGLSTGTWYWRAFAVSDLGTGYSEIQSFTVADQLLAPSVTTVSATQTGGVFTVTGSANDNGSSITERGFYFGSHGGTLTKHSISLTGDFTWSPTEPYGDYDFKAYAINSVGEGQGSIVECVYSVGPTAPSVTTVSITQVAGTFTLTGSSSDGGATITERGFYFGLQGGTMTKHSILLTGAFTWSPSEAYGAYQGKAYAINSVGEGQGAVLQCSYSQPSGSGYGFSGTVKFGILPIANATVIVINMTTNTVAGTAQSDTNGHYQVGSLDQNTKYAIAGWFSNSSYTLRSFTYVARNPVALG